MKSIFCMSWLLKRYYTYYLFNSKMIMKRIEYKLNDINATISHTEQDIECYQEHIDMIRQWIKDKTIDQIQWEKGIKELEEDREIDKVFLELMIWVKNNLLLKLNENENIQPEFR